MLTYLLVVIGVTGILFTLRALVLRLFFKIHANREAISFEFAKEDSPRKIIGTVLLRLNYFKALSPGGKEKFILRVEKLLHRVSFSSAGNILIDDEKRALVLACIVQITFGLEDFDIDSIEHVKLFEDIIYNPKTKVKYYGLTFHNGNMFLSWLRFLDGIKEQNDGINLGLHEAGHGLYILLKQNEAYEDFDDILSVWYKDSQAEIDHKDDHKNEFFRKYADASKEEFFAICIENFFERPQEFKTRLPEIYRQISLLLNQDPSNLSGDYQLIADGVASRADNKKRLYLHRNRWSSSYSVLIFLSYVSIIAFLLLKKNFLETFTNFVIFSIPCVLLSFFIFKKYFLDSQRLSLGKYVLLCTTTISPLLVIVLMALNIFIPVSSPRKVDFITDNCSLQGGITISQNDFAILDSQHFIYTLIGNNTVPIELRKLERIQNQPLKVEYTYHYGITGLKVYDGKKESSLE